MEAFSYVIVLFFKKHLSYRVFKAKMSIKVKCPICGESIDSWVVTTPNVPDSKNFKCFYCDSTLKSNHISSLKKAIIFGIIFYVLATILLNVFSWSKYVEFIIAIAGIFIPLLASFLIYRLSLKIENITKLTTVRKLKRNRR